MNLLLVNFFRQENQERAPTGRRKARKRLDTPPPLPPPDLGALLVERRGHRAGRQRAGGGGGVGRGEQREARVRRRRLAQGLSQARFRASANTTWYIQRIAKRKPRDILQERNTQKLSTKHKQNPFFARHATFRVLESCQGMQKSCRKLKIMKMFEKEPGTRAPRRCAFQNYSRYYTDECAD